MIFGGQIGNEAMRLFLVYSAGNFIEATRETCYFQIGESKYGKPVLDRMMRPSTPLDEAAKCVLVSMDSTLKSNLSVGLPLDLVLYEEGKLQSSQVVCIDDHNPYFRMIRDTWGFKLREIFESIDDPQWDGEGAADAPLCVPSERYEAMKKITHPGEKAGLTGGSAVSGGSKPPIVFSHANGFPAGTYAQLFAAWRAAGHAVHAVGKIGHDRRFPATSNWPQPDRRAHRTDRGRGWRPRLPGRPLARRLPQRAGGERTARPRPRRGAARFAAGHRLASRPAALLQGDGLRRALLARPCVEAAAPAVGIGGGGARAFRGQAGLRRIRPRRVGRLHRRRYRARRRRRRPPWLRSRRRDHHLQHPAARLHEPGAQQALALPARLHRRQPLRGDTPGRPGGHAAGHPRPHDDDRRQPPVPARAPGPRPLLRCSPGSTASPPPDTYNRRFTTRAFVHRPRMPNAQ